MADQKENNAARWAHCSVYGFPFYDKGMKKWVACGEKKMEFEDSIDSAVDAAIAATKIDFREFMLQRLNAIRGVPNEDAKVLENWFPTTELERKSGIHQSEADRIARITKELCW